MSTDLADVPPELAVAVAAVNQAGQESKVTSITIKYSLFLLVLLLRPQGLMGRA